MLLEELKNYDGYGKKNAKKEGGNLSNNEVFYFLMVNLGITSSSLVA